MSIVRPDDSTAGPVPSPGIRLGIMGFGAVGRQIYELALDRPAFAVPVISDLGAPDILYQLLARDLPPGACALDGNHLSAPRFRTRMLRTDHPREVPWDAFAVDAVVDATGRFRTRADMQAHLDNGARRVLLGVLPQEPLDRLLIPGINEHEARLDDLRVSAGSATTAAMALLLKVLGDRYPIVHASMTSVHAYTSDQSLQDYAGPDYRRSRSGAENIIPNSSATPGWIERVLPAFAGKVCGYSLNVPVQRGSLLDLNLVFGTDGVTAADINATLRAAAARMPTLIGIAEDPIVSSDVIGCSQSLLFDIQATMKAGRRIAKVLAWYETRGHASRVLDVLELYARLEATAASATASPSATSSPSASTSATVTTVVQGGAA